VQRAEHQRIGADDLGSRQCPAQRPSPVPVSTIVSFSRPCKPSEGRFLGPPAGRSDRGRRRDRRILQRHRRSGRADHREVGQLAAMVGKLGRTRHRAHVPNATGSWAAGIDSVNGLVDDLLQPRKNGAGDRSRRKRRPVARMGITSDSRELRGEFLHIRDVVETMVDQLGAFASEVTRVAREVGTEGKLGGQARVVGVAGIWMGSHRQGELDGRESHPAGAEHRGSHYLGGERRPVEKDHGRCKRAKSST
jgi:hypothetical protein